MKYFVLLLLTFFESTGWKILKREKSSIKKSMKKYPWNEFKNFMKKYRELKLQKRPVDFRLTFQACRLTFSFLSVEASCGLLRKSITFFFSQPAVLFFSFFFSKRNDSYYVLRNKMWCLQFGSFFCHWLFLSQPDEKFWKEKNQG